MNKMVKNIVNSKSQPKNSIGDMFPTEPSIYAEPMAGVKYLVSVTDDLDVPHTFDSVIALLSTATECDEIVFNINSGGGYVDSLNMLIGWKSMCPAKQTHVLMGRAASAATALFLSHADQYIVGDNAEFMCHEFQVGSGGTMSNSKRQTDHTYKQNQKFLQDSYEGFLTKEEIEDMQRGVEIYLDSKEIRERLEARGSNKSKQVQDDIIKEIEDDLSSLTDEELDEELKILQSEVKKRKATASKAASKKTLTTN